MRRMAREDAEGSGKNTKQSSAVISEIVRSDGNGSRGTRRRDGAGDFCFGITSGEGEREEPGVVGRVESDSASDREISASSVEVLLEFDAFLLCVRSGFIRCTVSLAS